MKKTKQELIAEFQASPPQIGDWVNVKGFSSYSPNKESTCVIQSIETDGFIVSELNGNGREMVKITQEQIIRKDEHKIGSNPFKQNRSRLRFINFSLESILHAIGFESREKKFRNEKLEEVVVQELNWNPTITNSEGKQIPYQRGFVWSTKDKQLLIESIYQGLDIGKIVIKKNSWKYVETQTKLGNTVCFKDVVDGKQRLNALIEFVQDGFEDLHGNKYSDLSEQAQHKFGSFQGVSYGEFDEDTTDAEIQETFVNVNFTGVQMSQEHLDYVRGIDIKK